MKEGDLRPVPGEGRDDMTDAPHASTDDAETARLRGADIATGLVLAIVAVLMIAEALTYPLEGTYAGVRNAWYVSPALFPLMIGGMLLILSAGLVAVAARDRARLRAGAAPRAPGQAGRSTGREAWFIATLLAAYIVELVPRVDFPSATALFLFVFMAGYIVEGRLRMALAGCLVLPSLLAFAVAMAGAWPAPRSGAQFVLDGGILATFLAACLLALRVAETEDRRRLRTAAVTSTVTAVLLSAIFRHGLLVPLPREGLGAITMERVAAMLSRLAG